MRLIDAHKLYEQYETDMSELVKSTNCENISLEALSLLCGAKLIADAPTVDATPVKHGKWKAAKAGGPNYPFWDNRCSECGYTTSSVINKWHYCPHCGAKMDGGGKYATD